MQTRTLLLLALFLALTSGCLWLDVVTTTDYLPPVPKKEAGALDDDPLDDTRKPEFDPSVVDRRPLGDWQVNHSAAVTRLDIAPAKPDVEKALLTLHKDYASAMAACKELEKSEGRTLLPSVNLIDGKAKQFDDGLYAALDVGYFKGTVASLMGQMALVQRLADASDKSSASYAYLGQALAAANTLALPSSVKTETTFANEVLNKPISFYTWNDDLKACYRFARQCQRTFPEDSKVVAGILQALRSDPKLLDQYRKVVTFYSKLSNPPECRSYLDLLEPKGNDLRPVALFPPSTSKENVLFAKLTAFGVPPGIDFMKELIRRIRSGEIDLRPTAQSGWYEYQLYALETLLCPAKGEEGNRLQLTKAYKKRMEEAFKAMMTKKRETHIRQVVPFAMGAAAPPGMWREPPKEVRPRLRVEPCPTYFVRQARAYAFLANFLESFVGKEGLESLHGLKKDGEREPNLYVELQDMKDLFYGLYLVSAEDIGLKPRFLPDEPVDQERCYRRAEEWLAKAFDDPDLAIDTRVAVPIGYDPAGKKTRLWAILGVRADKLDAAYARPPHIRPKDGGDWQLVELSRLDTSKYYIAVDEFAEIEARGVYTRAEWQALCDRGKTRQGILAEVGKLGKTTKVGWFR